jgi:hypothetical protein
LVESKKEKEKKKKKKKKNRGGQVNCLNQERKGKQGG